MIHRLVIPYDVQRYPFPFSLKYGSLSNLHLLFPDVHRRVLTQKYENDQGHVKELGLYESVKFRSLYAAFLRDVVRPMFGPIIAQRIPTFRVQFPGSKAVDTWHRETDFGHSRHEINLWVPLTPVEHSTNVHIVELPAGPLPIGIGSMLVFDGSLLHGNLENDTDGTRVSFDFRVVPRELYEDREEVTVAAGVPLKLGEYWGEVE